MPSASTSSVNLSEHKTKPLHVVVVGGSLAGLMSGIILRRHGHQVTILEQASFSERAGLAAGIGLSLHINRFFNNYDRLARIPLGITNSLAVRAQDMSLVQRPPVKQTLTTWDALYWRLRANFDYLTSLYCPEPPEHLPGDGQGVFKTGSRVQSVELGPDNRPRVLVHDIQTGETIPIHADYVIGADGINSTLRRQLQPKIRRREPGYCIWRGTVPVATLSAGTRELLKDEFIAYQMRSSYAVLYTIPGDNGSLAEDETHVNLAWYQYYTGQKELASILTDSDEHRHHTTLPKGKMRSETWSDQVRRAHVMMHPSLYELVTKISSPFVSVISSIKPQRAAFLNDRLFLIGDALFQVQPNSGSGSNMAAFGATTICDAILEAEKLAKTEQERKRRFRDWEYKILDRGEIERLTSILWANIFFRNRVGLAVCLIQKRLLLWRIAVAKCWRWFFRLGGDGPDGYEGVASTVR